jgi:hypothetical protein
VLAAFAETQDFALQIFLQHFPPIELHSKSSLHLGVQVVTCDDSGQLDCASANPQITTTISNAKINDFILETCSINWRFVSYFYTLFRDHVN